MGSGGKKPDSLSSSDFALTVNVPGMTISFLVLLKVWPFGLCAYIIIFLIFQYFHAEMILREVL